MRRIDDRGRHLRRDAGRLSRIDDAKAFKVAKKKLGIMSRRGGFVAMASGLGRCSAELRRSAVAAPRGQDHRPAYTDGAVIEINGEQQEAKRTNMVRQYRT